MDQSTRVADIDHRHGFTGIGDIICQVVGGHTGFFEMINDDHAADVWIAGSPRQEAAGHPQVGLDLAASQWVSDGDRVVGDIGYTFAQAIGVDSS